MPNTNTVTREDVRKRKKNASKSRSKDRANRGSNSPKTEKKAPPLRVIKLKPSPHHEKRHATAEERHRAQDGKTPPPGAFAGYAETREISQEETQAANRGKLEFDFVDAGESRAQTPFQESSFEPEEDQPTAAEKTQKIKRLAASALQAVSGTGSAAAASVRNKVTRARESRPAKAVRNHPARAGLIAAGITGLVAAGIFGTRAVRKNRAKTSGNGSTKGSSAKGSKKSGKSRNKH